jgi:uncharacterized membrane protein
MSDTPAVKTLRPLTKTRLEAFSDGVLAIIITIMVLELHTPEGHDWAALAGVFHTFLLYGLSFIYVGIYWNNHHHLLHTVSKISGGALWANLNLLFWLSIIPFTTSWMGESHFATVPTATYGLSLLMPSISYYVLVRVLKAVNGHDSALAQAIGNDIKGMISTALYIVGIGLTFLNSFAGIACYVLVALIWLIPDRRIEHD